MKTKRIIKAVVGVVLICAMLTSLFACVKINIPTRVSLKDCLNVTFYKFEGYGQALIDADEDALDTLVDKEKVSAYVKSISSDVLMQGSSTSVSFSDLLDFNLKENYNNLSNGDKVQVEVTVNEYLALYGETLESLQEGLNIKIKDTEMTFKVEGLETAEVLDVMSFVDDYIVYEGGNGAGKAYIRFPVDFTYEIGDLVFIGNSSIPTSSLHIVYNNNSIGGLTYECDGYQLSKDKEFKITATYKHSNFTGNAISSLYDLGYVINDTKTVTTPDLGEYIKSKDDATIELKKAIDDAIYRLDKDEYTIQEYYWGTIKPTTITNNLLEDEYRIFVVAYSDSWYAGKTYRYYGTNRLIRLPDGSYHVELSPQNYILSSYEDYYDCEKLEFN